MSATAESINSDDPSKTKIEPEDKNLISSEEEIIGNDDPVDDVDEDVVLDPRQEIAKNFDEKHRKYGSEEDEPEDINGNDEGDDGEVTLPEEPELITIKVNGKERQVEKAKADAAGGVETYQKQLSANESLREISENRKVLDDHAGFLKQKEAELAEREAALSSDAQHENDLPEINGDQKQELTEKAKTYREALFEGDEEAADAALVELLDATQGTPATADINEDQIVDTAASKTLQVIDQRLYEKELVTAYSSFREDFKDITEDPRLYQMADAETTVVRNEHPNWTPSQVMTEAGNRIRDWRDAKNGGSEDPTEQTTQSRLEEKRELSTPKASGGRKKPAAPKKAQTNSEYIKELRKSRGLE